MKQDTIQPQAASYHNGLVEVELELRTKLGVMFLDKRIGNKKYGRLESYVGLSPKLLKNVLEGDHRCMPGRLEILKVELARLQAELDQGTKPTQSPREKSEVRSRGQRRRHGSVDEEQEVLETVPVSIPDEGVRETTPAAGADEGAAAGGPMEGLVIAEHGPDWCHLCGERREQLADVFFAANAEHGGKSSRYIRICDPCGEQISQVARGLQSAEGDYVIESPERRLERMIAGIARTYLEVPGALEGLLRQDMGLCARAAALDAVRTEYIEQERQEGRLLETRNIHLPRPKRSGDPLMVSPGYRV